MINISQDSNDNNMLYNSFSNENNENNSNPNSSFNNVYHESQVENNNQNLLNSFQLPLTINNYSQEEDCFFNDNSYKKLIDKNSEDNSINEHIIEDNENSKFILYLKNNKFINKNKILDIDLFINQEKKYYEQKLTEISDKIKCKGCSKIPNEFFICSLCKAMFCENCLGTFGINNWKFCINCNQLVSSNEHFIKIPIFKKISTYINTFKETNEKLFNNKIKKNLDMCEILCCEDEHKINKEDSLEINNDIKKGINLNIHSKAIYFCMTCLKPFCSDCILNYKLKDKNIQNENNINSNELNNENNKEDKKEHNYNHPIFKISLLKDSGVFDLLYERNKSQKTISYLESFEQSIKDKIESLIQNRENMTLFLEYIKNLYINKIDEVINNLKIISQEKNEKIQIIKEKTQKLSNFLNILKTKNDLINKENINTIKSFLNDFNSFHIVPFEIKKKSKKFISFKGELNLENISKFSFNFNLKESFKKKFNAVSDNIFDITLKTKNSNTFNNFINNQIIEEQKLYLKIKQNKNNKTKKKINEYYSFPILINNNNKNEFILFKESPKNDINIKDKEIKKEKDMLNNNIKINYNEDSFNSNPFIKIYENKNSIINEEENKKIYVTEINFKNLKKINDDTSNINCDLYHINIF